MMGSAKRALKEAGAVPRPSAAIAKISLRDDFNFQFDEIVDQMHTKSTKEASRSVQDIPASPIE
jgi:hypothetical protein